MFKVELPLKLYTVCHTTYFDIFMFSNGPLTPKIFPFGAIEKVEYSFLIYLRSTFQFTNNVLQILC